MKSVYDIVYNAAIISYSIFATYYIIIPTYAYIQQNVLPLYSAPIESFRTLTGYDFSTNHVYNTWILCGVCGYFSMGLFCGVLDIVLPITFKTQASRSYFSFTEWTHALGLSMFNLFVSSWVLMLPINYVYKISPFPEDTTPIVLSTEIMKFVLCAVVVETWFFFTHWTLHHPLLYSRIHKIHHRFKAPIAVASMYAHPIEFVVGNLTGVILGPLLTRCHPITSYIWICNSLISTGGSHSGYMMCFADFHDQHHQYFDFNFGVGK